MAKHVLPSDVHDNAVINEVERAVSEVLVSQKWYEKRKNSLFAVGQLILQAANVGTVFLVGAPWWVAVIVGVAISLGEVLTHSRTKGPVTPSGAQRIIQRVEQETQRALDRERVPVWHNPALD